MKLPEIKNNKNFVGLYVVDFGGHCGVGFTAQETAELLESERFSDVKVYKIYRAYPDGKMELKGMPKEIFNLEKAMLFYAYNEISARKDYKNIVSSAVRIAPPCRSRVELKKINDSEFITAIIYPAEFDDEVSKWLIETDYKTSGAIQGGNSATENYNAISGEILEKHQLFAADTIVSRTGAQLLIMADEPIQRFA